jgi:hypothetical protein
MRDQLKLEAGTNNRSLNAEIVARLTESFAWPMLSSVMRAQLEGDADLNGHSLANEILARLEFTMRYDREFFDPKMDWSPSPASQEDKIDRLERKLDTILAAIGTIGLTEK